MLAVKEFKAEKLIYKPGEYRPYLHTREEWLRHGFKISTDELDLEHRDTPFRLKKGSQISKLWCLHQVDLVDTRHAARARHQFDYLYAKPDGYKELERRAMDAINEAWYKTHRSRFTVMLAASDAISDFVVLYGLRVYPVEYCHKLMNKMGLR
jgi:hypothetical protein